MTHAFVDCQGLAGAWTLGSVQAGLELRHRVSLGDFGDSTVARNLDALGAPGLGFEPGTRADWTPQEGVAYVCGTPPCSGFSVYNTSEAARGPNAPINSCMRDLALYGASCVGEDGRQGAEVIAFESVQGAFSAGRSLMQALRDLIEETSGQRYELTHVKMSGASIGSAQYRHRYYFVAHRVPFSVERPAPRAVTTAEDALGDLEGLELQWEDQPYATSLASPWGFAKRRGDALVGDHQTREESHRMIRLIDEIADGWLPGEYMQDRVARYGRRGLVDELFPTRWNEDEGTLKGLPRHWPKRLRPGSPTGVVTGNSSLSFVHYKEDRFLTVRELSRLMGYPDSWRWPESTSVDQASSLIGKCCPVDSGRWISQQVLRSLNDPEYALALSDETSELIGPGERLHDSTLDYRRWDADVSGWTMDRRVLAPEAQ